MPMKILLYGVNFAPEPTGVGKYSGEMATWLADRGHSIRVVTAPPYYPNWEIDPNYARPRFRREQWRGVDVWRAPLWVPKSPSGLTRVLHLASFALMSFPVVLRQVFWHPDLILTVAPALMCAPAGLLAARLCGAQSWLHLQDFEVNIAFRMGLLRGRLLKRIVLKMERWLLRRFDSVSTISNRMVEQLIAKGVKSERTRYLPNWVDIAHIKPSKAKGIYRAELGIAADAIVVLSSGTLSGKQGLTAIPKLAKYLVDRKDILFVICGDGPMKTALQAAGDGLPNLLFIPLQPFGLLGELLCMADIHLLTQRPDAADLVLPSKLSGMLASARPVITTCHAGTELETIVSKCGLVVPPDDIPELAGAVCKLADDQQMRQELGRRGRAFAEKTFERDAVLGNIFSPTEVGESVTQDVPI
jgi:colanic acid biosynthesis glycosyl transferase WcaI